jgi:E3 ubiquitin-protein ligase TRIP12
VRISRKHLLESALKVFEMYAGAKAQLEIEYFGEVGTGEQDWRRGFLRGRLI